jgi:dienelactone hydrolase
MQPIVLAAVALAVAAIPEALAQTDHTAKARAVIERLAAQDFAAVTTEFNETLKKAVSEERLRSSWTAIVEEAGAFKQITGTRVETRGAARVTIVTIAFERFPLQAEFTFDAQSRVSGFNIRPSLPGPPPPSPMPSYADSSAFADREVVIGSGELTLPGTLSMPARASRVPALILVHGSGPQDRDATLGPNKPFRDLAAGLASRGVAVLRYEKRTRQHPAKMAALRTLTVKEETIDDVLAAAELLRTTPGINPDAVYVLGHSLGGTVIPRIADADPKLAGFIVLAGLTRPLVETIAAQVRYIALADGTISAAERQQIADTERVVQELNKLQPEDAASGRLIAGAPASYWLDLRNYDPASAAKAIQRPMLVLQGERDYQVTMEDFKRWRDALTGRSSVTFKSYPALNHLFIPGRGPSMPAEYQQPGHVAEEVVRDIAAWVLRTR